MNEQQYKRMSKEMLKNQLKLLEKELKECNIKEVQKIIKEDIKHVNNQLNQL